MTVQKIPMVIIKNGNATSVRTVVYTLPLSMKSRYSIECLGIKSVLFHTLPVIFSQCKECLVIHFYRHQIYTLTIALGILQVF